MYESIKGSDFFFQPDADLAAEKFLEKRFKLQCVKLRLKIDEQRRSSSSSGPKNRVFSDGCRSAESGEAFFRGG